MTSSFDRARFEFESAHRNQVERAAYPAERDMPTGSTVIIDLAKEPCFHGRRARVLLHQAYSTCTVAFIDPAGPVVPYPDVPPPMTWVFAVANLRVQGIP